MHKHARKIAISLALAGSLFATASSAFAFDCNVANKPSGAGSVGALNLDTGTFTPTKNNSGTDTHPHGGFVTVTGTTPDGSTLTVDTFVHAPTKSREPGAELGVNPGALKQTSQGRGCDGKGLDTVDACFGG